MRDKSRWAEVSNLSTSNKINYTHAKNMGIAIRVETPISEDYRALTRFLTYHKVGYHTFALPEERKVRAVLRNDPYELATNLIHKDLNEQGFPVESVYKMHSRAGRPFPLAPIRARDIFKAKDLRVCGLTGVKVEPPHQRGTPGQCHRCQLYGHAATNCSATSRMSRMYRCTGPVLLSDFIV
ncbi:unnamed protein product [Diatraea saccharalis]|uniref:Pre-C2HC domain-containing protein n=1 Tax=Diatraea saccharalis TaxID=40085 RepID=A0A9N9RD72_9NEOP|nr:unnamed protein product [Diatraea saccharalis]